MHACVSQDVPRPRGSPEVALQRLVKGARENTSRLHILAAGDFLSLSAPFAMGRMNNAAEREFTRGPRRPATHHPLQHTGRVFPAVSVLLFVGKRPLAGEE